MSDEFKMLDDDVGWRGATTRIRKRIKNRWRVVREACLGLPERENESLRCVENQIQASSLIDKAIEEYKDSEA